MASQIDFLIDKLDTFEIVRDQIAQILADEIAEQQVLAIAAAKDPELWNLSIFTERWSPWERFRDDKTEVPVVNVWYDRSSFQQAASNVVERQQVEGTFNIDMVAQGVAKSDGAAGQIAGDEAAAFNVQRATRLVRNILMASQFTYLDLRPVVGRRWVQTVESFQPAQGEQAVPRISAMRLTLAVVFDEFNPQFTPETLEEVGVTIKRGLDGSVLAKQEFPIT